MRATKVFNRILGLSGTRVVDVEVPGEEGAVLVRVALRRRRWMACPSCDHMTQARYDVRPVDSRWRHLDVGGRECWLVARLFRIRCPSHGVVTEAVPFAGAGSRFTIEFERLCAWLATRADKTSVQRFLRIAWRTVGQICARVVDRVPADDRFEQLVTIGVDEISWRKHHKYLSIVSDHATGKVIWGAEGRDAATLGQFYDSLTGEQKASIQAVSMDMGPAYVKATRQGLPRAVICFDPFHVVKLATDALEETRRSVWRQLKDLPDKTWAKRLKGARWVLLKNHDDLDPDQRLTLRHIKKEGGALYRGWQLKEALREIFAGDLDMDDLDWALRRWRSRASRSRIPAFVKAARTIGKHLAGIKAAIEHRLSNARNEGINNKIRVIFNRAHGFHSAQAALALVMLACGPVEIILPHR